MALYIKLVIIITRINTIKICNLNGTYRKMVGLYYLSHNYLWNKFKVNNTYLLQQYCQHLWCSKIVFRLGHQPSAGNTKEDYQPAGHLSAGPVAQWTPYNLATYFAISDCTVLHPSTWNVSWQFIALSMVQSFKNDLRKTHFLVVVVFIIGTCYRNAISVPCKSLFNTIVLFCSDFIRWINN